MRTMLIIGLALAGCVLSAAPSAAQGDRQELDGTPIAGPIYRSFDGNWRKYARYACDTGEGFGLIPAYDRRFDSSRNLTVSQALEKMKKTWEERQGNLVYKKQRTPPRAEAEAYARALPDTRVGSYGYLAAARVVEVIDDEEMLIDELWLVDIDALRKKYADDERASARRNNGEANRDELNFIYATRIKLKEQQEERDELFEETFRLVGYDTRGLRPGDRWKGPNNEGFQVGVMRWETPEPREKDEGEGRSRRSRGSDDPRLVLSELERTMRKGVDEQGFKQMLAERGMTVAEFVDLVRTLRERDRENAETRILNALLPEDTVRDDD